MAVLQKIRQRSVLLIVLIGFSLLAFIVQDLYSNGGFNSQSKYVGSVNGKDIAFEEFNQKVVDLSKNGGSSTTQSANRIWDQEVIIALYTQQFDLLGIRAGESSIYEILKADQSIGQNPAFLNEAGVFDVAKFKEYFKSNPELEPVIKKREMEAEISARYEIYNSMIKAGLYTTETEGKFKYQQETDKVTFDYVSILYSTIKNSDVKVTEAEIIDFMKKDEKKYKADETRELEYVLFEEKASPQDEEEIKTKINALLNSQVVYNKATGNNDTIPGFKDVPNTIEFVNENSDKAYDSTYVTKQQLPAQYADALFNLPQGEIYGPYMDGEYYCITKAVGRKAGGQAKASHILISYEGTRVPNQKEKRTKEQAKAKADMLFAQIQANPGLFTMNAFTNSDDSSSQSGGDLGTFSPGQMVKPFNDFVFNNPVGKIGLVETEFGYHIINITGKEDAVRLATIAQKIQPSDITTDKIYQDAIKFEMQSNEKDFKSVAKASKLTISPATKVKVMDEVVGAIGSQRQIVNWAYNKDTKVGDIKRFEIANVGNVIVKFNKINPEGLLSMEEAKIQVEPILIKKKKMELIKAKIKGNSLDAIAKSTGTTVQQAIDVTFENANLTNVGQEKAVVGTAFGIGVNKTSGPIEGILGVYVVNTKAITKGLPVKNYSETVSKIKQQTASYPNRVVEAMKEKATIENNLSQFNY
jgi:peptidyl-prolyl cis-trans isomerase D